MQRVRRVGGRDGSAIRQQRHDKRGDFLGPRSLCRFFFPVPTERMRLRRIGVAAAAFDCSSGANGAHRQRKTRESTKERGTKKRRRGRKLNRDSFLATRCVTSFSFPLFHAHAYRCRPPVSLEEGRQTHLTPLCKGREEAMMKKG